MYDEFIPKFSEFLTKVLFDFSVDVIKYLAKLKIYLDINFQTFDKIKVNLKKNAAFLSTSISQINLKSFRLVKFPSFTNSILFLKIVLKNLLITSLEPNILMILFQICEKLSDLEDPTLNFEIFELMLIISEHLSLQSEKFDVLFDRMLLNTQRLYNLLQLSDKWFKKKKYTQEIIRLWRKNSQALFQLVQYGRIGINLSFKNNWRK